MGHLSYKRFTSHIVILLSSMLLACGGGGSGGGGNSGSGNNGGGNSGGGASSLPAVASSTSVSSVPSSSGPSTTLTLGTPTTNPILIPPSATPTSVKFLSVVRGTYYPEKLILDEIDKDGNLILPGTIATLKDDGVLPDMYKGDQIYSGELLLSSVAPTERSYRVRADHKGTDVQSGVGRFWVSGCPARARQPDPSKAVLDTKSDSYIFANEVLVTLTDTVPQQLDDINELLKGAKGKVVGCIPALRQYLVELPDSSTAESLYTAIDILKSKPEQVAEVTPNALVLSPEKESATACDGQCQWYLERIRAPEAWAIAGGGDEQMGVGLIDFGVDCLLSDVKCVLGRGGDINYSNGINGRDHGTGVASLIGAQKELPDADPAKANQMVGVAWNTALHPYSFEQVGGSQYQMSQLITMSMSEANIRVINISAAVGIDQGKNIRNAMCSAIASGRLIVAAAGNASAARNCQWPEIYPAGYNTANPLDQCTNGADLAKGLLVVGSIDADNKLAEWEIPSDDPAKQKTTLCSNTLYVDLYAPGKNIFAASTDGSHYGTKNGTSFSAPLVAGAAAVLWAAKPTLTVSEVHDRLIASAAIYAKTAKQTRNQTQDPRMEGKHLLDLFAAVGGKDAVIPPKLIPEPFEFGTRNNAEQNAVVTSDSVTIKGIEAAVPVSIKGGFYSIDNAPFTSAAGTLEPNQTLRVQLTTADTPLVNREATVTLGTVSKTFQVATAAVALVPVSSFNFNDVANAALGSSVLSGILGITGLPAATAISIVGGEYSIEGGAFTSAKGTVNANQAIQLRVKAAEKPETKVTATVTIGNVSDTFSATTVPIDILPDAFTFTDAYSVEPATVLTSNVITLTGINTAATISVSGGEYSIDGGEYRTTAGSVVAGQTVQIRHRSASGFSSDSYTSVSIGNYSTSFHSRTVINPEDVKKFLLIMPAILHLTLYP